MPYIFKALLITLCLTFISASHADIAKPRFLAVTFHADWCGSCLALAPKIEKARAKANLDQTDVLFVKLDLTDDNTTHQASLLAQSLGIGALFEHNNGKTGYVAVIEASSGTIISKITKNNKIDEMIALLDLDQ